MRNGVILYLVDAMFGNRFWFPLFETLYRSENYRFDAVCFHRHQREAFRDIPACREVFPEPELVQGYAALPGHYDAELAAWASALEQELDCLIVDLIQADRHLGIGFQPAGLNNPMTENRRRASYWRTLRYLRLLDARVDAILDKSQPSVIVTSVVADLYSKLICAKGRRRGIPVRMFNSLQVGSTYGWYHDEFWNHPPLKALLRRKIEAAPQTQADGVSGADTRPVAAAQREPIYATHYLSSLTKGLRRREVLRSLLREAKVALGRLKTPRPDRPGFLESARLQLRIRRQYDELSRRVRRQGDRLPERFVLFALHKEPEASTMVKAPEFNHQLAIIDLVARSLPAGFLLLVKESMVSLGYRSEGFYETLAAYPNVRLAMPDLRASDLLDQAAGAVVITGTVGLEAARLGLPVFSFGTRNNYDVLDHVHVVGDLRDLRKLLHRELLEVTPGERARRAALGSLYDESAGEIGLDIGEFFEANRRSKAPVPQPVIEACLAALRRSLAEADAPLRRAVS
ncbi:MAG: hypothetical protein ACFCUW_05830 [Kiloniellaceae bacterium]